MLAVIGMAIVTLQTSVYAQKKQIATFGSFSQSEITDVPVELIAATFDDHGMRQFLSGKKYHRVGCEGYYRYFSYESLQWDVLSDRNGYLTLMTKLAVACVPYDNHTSSSIYLSGRGVCANYAAAFKDFCDAAGIPATIVDAAEGNHAFNSVYLDGRWYLIDTTGGKLRESKEYIRSNPLSYVTSITSPSHYEGKYSRIYLKIAQNVTLKSY